MRPAEPVLLVIVGISGDLAKRKLLPALYHLEQDGLLPDQFKIIGTTRGRVTIDTLKEHMTAFVRSCRDDCDDSSFERFFDRLHITQADPTSAEGVGTIAQDLVAAEAAIDGCATRLFYLAVPPQALASIVRQIGQAQADRCNHGSKGRVLIEKPFGHDVTSAQQLIDLLGQYFDESQLYRIDHYLAKDTVQNILHFRFHNPLVRDIWKSAYIDHVQITAAESIGIEGRVNFYEQTGAVRDFIQSHMLQLVALTAMEDPQDLSAQSVRRAREQILRNLRPINLTGSEAVRGQYLSYREEVGKPGSVIETFAAIKVIVDTDRWHDTPIYVRTGKQLAAKLTEINLVYSDEPKEHTTNILTVRIQPNEGIAVKLIAKKPGLTHETEEILMDYCYALDARRIRHEAYEKLLLDAMNGDQTLFPSATEIMTNWRYVEPLLAQWHAADEGLFHYKSDSWGPPASDGLLADEHIGWINDERGICQVRFDQTG